MVGSVECANVLCTHFFCTDFPVLFTPPKRTPCTPTPVALTTLPALWPAGYPWKQPRSWRKLRPVWQLWQWMWKTATPLLFWETAEGGCTRYDLHAAKRMKLTRDAQVEGEKGSVSFSLGSWVPIKHRYYRVVSSHTVLPVENMDASNVVTLPLHWASSRAGASYVVCTGISGHVLHVAEATAQRFWWEVKILAHSGGCSLFLL